MASSYVRAEMSDVNNMAAIVGSLRNGSIFSSVANALGLGAIQFSLRPSIYSEFGVLQHRQGH